MRRLLLPVLAAALAGALSLPAGAHAHALFQPGWWKGKKLTQIVKGQRTIIAHDRAVIRSLQARPEMNHARHHRVLRSHRIQLRNTKRELGETLAAARAAKRAAAREAKRAAAAAAAAAAAGAAASSAPASTASGGAGGYASGSTAQCESGGDPSAVSADGTYRGKWQFDQQTWDAHAPAGWQGVDPAAAPEAVQDQAAGNVTYDAWPNC